jgi:hypothetical protein
MRRAFILHLMCFMFCVGAVCLQAKQLNTSSPPNRDEKAVSILTVALDAAGGASAFAAIQDYRATGTATYYWAGQEFTGNTTISGRGNDQFRIVTTLPNGTYVMTVSNRGGTIREVTGKTTPLPFHNAANKGNLTFPLAELAVRLRDNSVAISYVGATTFNGVTVHQVRTYRVLGPDSGNGQLLNKLTTRDFFIDTQSFQVVGTLDMVHPNENATRDYRHELVFADFRTVDGVLVPFSITESIAGQHTWTIQLSAINYNVGLADVDFQP